MSAVQTALNVIRWASQSRAGPPPQGDSLAIEKLIDPPRELCDVLRELTVITSARLRYGRDSASDVQPLHSDVLILAVAVGIVLSTSVGQPLKLLDGVSRNVTRSSDLLARHGLISPSLPYLSAVSHEIDTAFRSRSPLTGLLTYPNLDDESDTVNLALEMLTSHTKRAQLTLTLAQLAENRRVRDWRTRILMRLRVSQVDFVIDVYEATMIHHRQEALAQIAKARQILGDRVLASDDTRLAEALSIAAWWKPLALISRSELSSLRARRYLGYDYLAGIELYRRATLLVGG